MGIDFITLDNEYMHKIMVIALIREGIQSVKPSALFAKLFEVVPKKIATAKNIYGTAEFI